MTQSLHIPVDELRRAATTLLDHLEAVRGEVVEVPDGAFWAIPADARRDVYTEPQDFTIGQVGESWGNVLSAVNATDASVSYGLVWLADVLREIGERTVQ